MRKQLDEINRAFWDNVFPMGRADNHYVAAQMVKLQQETVRVFCKAVNERNEAGLAAMKIVAKEMGVTFSPRLEPPPPKVAVPPVKEPPREPEPEPEPAPVIIPEVEPEPLPTRTRRGRPPTAAPMVPPESKTVAPMVPPEPESLDESVE